MSGSAAVVGAASPIRMAVLVAGDETGHVVDGIAVATVDLDAHAPRRVPFVDCTAAEYVDEIDLAVDHRAFPYLAVHLQGHCC